MIKQNELYSTLAAADAISTSVDGITEAHIKKALTQGELVGRKIGKAWVITGEQLWSWLNGYDGDGLWSGTSCARSLGTQETAPEEE